MVSLVGYASRTGGAGSITVPAHVAGDILVFVNGNQTATPPTLLAGWADLGTVTGTVSGPASRSARAQWIESDGSIATVAAEYYGHLWVLRGANGARATSRQANSTVTSIAIPVLSGLDTAGLSYLIACSYLPDNVSAVTAPWTLAGGGTNDYGAIANNSSASSPSSTSLTVVSSVDLAFTIEVTPRRASATVAVTEAADTLSSAAKLQNRGVVAITEQDDTLAASNLVPRVAAVAITEAADTIAAAGALRITASAALVEAGDTVSGAIDLVIIAVAPPERTITFAAARRDTRSLSLD